MPSRSETGADKVNVIGYCVGGTLLGTTLAYLAARGEEPFASATFFAAQVDFTNAGDSWCSSTMRSSRRWRR